jgi:hypothetical protein
MRFTVGVLVFLFGASAAVSAQSLVELAEKEKKRREAVKGSGKVITEKDLGRRSRTPPPADATEAQTTSSPEAQGTQAQSGEGEEKSPSELREEKRAEIQRKIDEQVGLIRAVQEVIDETQLELNDLTDLTFGSRRQKLLNLIESSKAEIAGFEQEIANLEEEARRAGVRVSRQ